MNARRILLLAGAGLLAGCAGPRRPKPPPEPYALRLHPASLGRELALQQRMTLMVYGHAQQLDMALEVDAQAVRLAVLGFGQTLARLEWDGEKLTESRAPGMPPAVTGARVLSDIQLVYWPAEAIRAALPRGWSLEASEQARLLRAGSTPMIRVRYSAPDGAELENFAGHYRLRLDSVELR